MSISIQKGAVANHDQILSTLEKHKRSFVPCTQPNFDNLNSRFRILENSIVNRVIYDNIFQSIRESKPQCPVHFYQIQLHEKGDYTLPGYVFPKVRTENQNINCSWLRIYVLSTSQKDGITIISDNQFVRIIDEENTCVTIDENTWCWVSPVVGSSRYTFLIGGYNEESCC
jgi:hypothetical protein